MVFITDEIVEEMLFQTEDIVFLIPFTTPEIAPLMAFQMEEITKICRKNCGQPEKYTLRGLVWIVVDLALQ